MCFPLRAQEPAVCSGCYLPASVDRFSSPYRFDYRSFEGVPDIWAEFVPLKQIVSSESVVLPQIHHRQIGFHPHLDLPYIRQPESASGIAGGQFRNL